MNHAPAKASTSSLLRTAIVVNKQQSFDSLASYDTNEFSAFDRLVRPVVIQVETQVRRLRERDIAAGGDGTNIDSSNIAIPAWMRREWLGENAMNFLHSVLVPLGLVNEDGARQAEKFIARLISFSEHYARSLGEGTTF
jgi:hypothetical protein